MTKDKPLSEFIRNSRSFELTRKVVPVGKVKVSIKRLKELVDVVVNANKDDVSVPEGTMICGGEKFKEKIDKVFGERLVE